MKLKFLIKGIIKNIPGIEYLYEFNKRTGGTCSARYCYSVWLRHLLYAYNNGHTSIPKVVAELGPGDTLGTGLAALISGSEKYYALDIKKYSNPVENLKIFEELVDLFKQKTDIPDDKEFPRLRPLLADYSFPEQIFTKSHLDRVLNDQRILKIRSEILTIDQTYDQKQTRHIEYKVPWDKKEIISAATVDMVFSQAVLQAVDDLETTYNKINYWLKPNGIQSHDIGFKSCGTADTWYGHWEYSEIEWKIIRGRKAFIINREPYSTHRKLLNNNNFEMLVEIKEYRDSNINCKKIASKYKDGPKEDFKTYSVFFQAVKS